MNFPCNLDNTYMNGDQGHRRERGGGGGSSGSSREVMMGGEEEGKGGASPALYKYVNGPSFFPGAFSVFGHDSFDLFSMSSHPASPPPSGPP